ncbi:hypothetical protein C4K18_3607 [Pseudomonas chlororaphis subsp. aurantiaca]|nr:hypothetical protein C4K18_3607 [Pseudomonas chlororaphis subsp. aurantiaca]
MANVTTPATDLSLHKPEEHSELQRKAMKKRPGA